MRQPQPAKITDQNSRLLDVGVGALNTIRIHFKTTPHTITIIVFPSQNHHNITRNPAENSKSYAHLDPTPTNYYIPRRRAVSILSSALALYPYSYLTPSEDGKQSSQQAGSHISGHYLMALANIHSSRANIKLFPRILHHISLPTLPNPTS